MRKSWGGLWLGITGKNKRWSALSTHPVQRPLELRPGARGQTKPAEAGFILEEERQTVVEVCPSNDPTGSSRSRLDALIRRAEGDEYFTPISAPAGHAFISEAGIRTGDPPKVLVERLVLGRDLVGIGLGVELPP